VSSIQFSPHKTNDSKHYVVAFRALLDGKGVECAISYQALRTHFGADYDDPLPAFTTHRPHIEQLAAQFISQKRFEPDGTILMRSYDLG
jgi:uncharacterized protein DUF1488